MRRAVLMLGLFLSVLCCSFLPAGAADFSADMVTTASGQTNTSKIFVKDTKIRMEHPGQPMFTIIRMDKNVSWMVMTDQKSYMEMNPDPKNKVTTDEKVKGEVSRKLVGIERVSGLSAKKYEVTFKDGQRTSKVYQWMASGIKFPVKTAAVDGSWTNEYRNIKVGSQQDSLFEVPAGYKKISMPAIPGMPGVPGASGKSRMPQLPR